MCKRTSTLCRLRMPLIQRYQRRRCLLMIQPTWAMGKRVKLRTTSSKLTKMAKAIQPCRRMLRSKLVMMERWRLPTRMVLRIRLTGHSWWNKTRLVRLTRRFQTRRRSMIQLTWLMVKRTKSRTTWKRATQGRRSQLMTTGRPRLRTQISQRTRSQAKTWLKVRRMQKRRNQPCQGTRRRSMIQLT